MGKKTYKLFWDLHKWTGIAAGAFLLMIAVTGFFLLLKKEFAWIQPPTQEGAEGGVAEFITNQRLFEAVFAAGHRDFADLDDIDRVDFRPGKRVFKVRSQHSYMEMQVDAVTGAVLTVADRKSDLFERLHDGSWFAPWLHDWIMPLVALSLSFLVGSGLYLWIDPLVRKRRKKARLKENAS